MTQTSDTPQQNCPLLPIPCAAQQLRKNIKSLSPFHLQVLNCSPSAWNYKCNSSRNKIIKDRKVRNVKRVRYQARELIRVSAQIADARKRCSLPAKRKHAIRWVKAKLVHDRIGWGRRNSIFLTDPLYASLFWPSSSVPRVRFNRYFAVWSGKLRKWTNSCQGTSTPQQRDLTFSEGINSLSLGQFDCTYVRVPPDAELPANKLSSPAR